MNWAKLGHIFNVSGAYSWNQSHAQVPVVDILFDRLRIYYATRNLLGQSNISYIEVDKQDPSKILYEHNDVLLDFGPIGTFDDSGIMPSCIIQINNLKYLYYIGWTTRFTVPYQNAIGLAVSKDEGRSFQKIAKGPIITVNRLEPYFSGTSFVLEEKDCYKMYYLSCIGWVKSGNKPEPIYHIKYAESLDGINWEQTGKIAVDLQPGEGGLASAAVIKENDTYKMWFGKRGILDYRKNPENTYKIGYAESKDGIHWERKDENAGIKPSESGWDSQMISYPYVVKVDRQFFMFYNGNNFGKSGFGVAKMVL